MKKAVFMTGIVLLICAISNPCFANLRQFAGNWKNADPNTRGITTIKIAVNGTNVTVHAWGKCTPKDCDWGTVRARAYAPNVSSDLSRTAKALSAVFKMKIKDTLLIIRPLRGRMLQVESYSHFTRGDRTAYVTIDKFKMATSTTPSVREDCIRFNPKSAKVEKKSGRWKIVDGNQWMFDFGTNKAEAIKALKIIKHYGMNVSCFVGRPKASFKYMRVNNQAPSGALSVEDCISFNPNSIAVRNISGRWKIVDGSHIMFDFGNKESEARQALAIIKKYGFRKSCFVGRPDPSFEYLRK